MRSLAVVIDEIDALADFVRSQMHRVAEHRKVLELENPEVVPLQDAIIEKELRDNGLPIAMAAVKQTLARDDLPPEAYPALNRLECVFEEAALLLSSAALDQ